MSHPTPGPWHVGSGSAARIVYAANGWAIADAKVYHGGNKSGEDFENARLMAAAPDLLEALKRARRQLVPSECDLSFIDKAIAKAEEARP